MDIQWPLVLFSLIAGTGGSLFAFVALSELVGGKDKTRFAATVTVLVLIVVGGCLSMLHLASPQNAFAALTNIFSFSGISIELMLLGLTFVAAAAYAIVVKRVRNAAAAEVLALVGGILGLALGYFCGHGYVIEAQPTWMHESLPLAYFGTSLACGAFAYDIIASRLGDGKRGAARPHARSPHGVHDRLRRGSGGLCGSPRLRCGHGPWRCVLGRSCALRHRRNPGCRSGAPCRTCGSGFARRRHRPDLRFRGRGFDSRAHVGVRHGLPGSVRPYRSQRHAESLEVCQAASSGAARCWKERIVNTEEAVSLLGSRADFYRQIAQWYFAPLSEEQIEALAAQDLRALAEDDQSSYAEGYNDLYRALRLRHTGTRQALAADFTGAFYGVTTAEGETAQPFESLYRYDGGSLMGQPRGEVYRALKQARLKVREGLDLPDGPTSLSSRR